MTSLAIIQANSTKVKANFVEIAGKLEKYSEVLQTLEILRIFRPDGP